MDNHDIEVLLQNQSLKFEFAIRNLDLTQVFYATPDDLERENRFLHHLLDWVQKYSEYRDRTRMEIEGYHFPPIDPGISPENDWHRFEQWIQGRPIRQKLKEHLPPNYTPKNPEHLTDEAIISEIQKLSVHLAHIRVSVDIQEELPPRLVYDYLQFDN
ncbi:MAG: hypothetical protein KDJ97_16200 [Anaerolineae bacterium]|nr:hypothetical protein [Anaerolineae bacterium]